MAEAEAVKAQIFNLEERLRQAMLASDVKVLDELFAPEIILTNHVGELLGKQDALASHGSDLFKIHELNPSEQHISIYGEVALVSVRMQLSGSYKGSLRSCTCVIHVLVRVGGRVWGVGCRDYLFSRARIKASKSLPTDSH